MNHKDLNPYQTPGTASVVTGHARVRLRRWFAVALFVTLIVLYLALISDLFRGPTFGIVPFLISTMGLMLVLITTLLTRHRAEIVLDDTSIVYRDLVQMVDVSWDRVIGVFHTPNKTLLATNSRLIQITISRRHKDYEEIARRIDELKSKFDLKSSTTTTRSTPIDNPDGVLP